MRENPEAAAYVFLQSTGGAPKAMPLKQRLKGGDGADGHSGRSFRGDTTGRSPNGATINA